MIQQEIIENNQIIAEFMGAWTKEAVQGWIGKELKYNLSWDWLMPVVQKCTELTSKFQYDEKYMYITEDMFHPDYTLSSFLNDNKEDIWARVVEFIKWYNTQNNGKEN